VDDAPLPPAEIARLADKVEKLDANVSTLQRRVDELSGYRPPDHDPGPPGVAGRTPSPAIKPIELEMLADWVDWLQERYAAAGDWLRPCWWRHGFVVHELAALRTAWIAVYQPDEPAQATAALQWHESAEKCRERIRLVIGSGPGCTAVTHKPDQPVTDDPRWSEERAALQNETPELSVLPRAKEDANSRPGNGSDGNDGLPRARP
jgi:hypothetical protein